MDEAGYFIYATDKGAIEMRATLRDPSRMRLLQVKTTTQSKLVDDLGEEQTTELNNWIGHIGR